ncbi:MAG: Ig-like domain repeat protein [Clostridia bacterium]|nr:Ig-like domain repeat protein [Clostridia bacterium]
MKTGKRCLSLLLSVLMVLGAVSAGFSAGAADQVYEISNYGDLVEFAQVVNGNEDEGIAPDPSASAVLTADIFATYNPVEDPESDEIEYAKDWVAIANSGDRPFTGTFDGRGYKITGLDNSEAGQDDKTDSGLFGFIGEGGSVKNVRLENARFEGMDIGGIAYENNGTIQNCSFDGSTGGYGSGGAAGGIACDNYGTITNCYNNGSVSGDGPVGGIAGSNDGTITNCYNTGGITGDNNGYDVVGAGGIAGSNGGTVANCYNTGDVTGNGGVGGIIGYSINSGATTNCYNTGNVTGNNRVGGIAGYMNKNNPSWDCSVTNCYSAGGVTLSGENAQHAGGVVGYNDNNCTVANCYYDSEKCTLEEAVGYSSSVVSETVTGLSTAEMTGETALDNMSGLSSDSWLVRANADGWAYYPHLKGFAYDTDPTDANWPAKTEPPKADPGITLTVAPEQPVYGDAVTITANLPDDATGDITLTVDGIDYTVPVKDGKAVCPVGVLVPGTYSVTVSYSGDDVYNPVTQELTVEIPKYSFTVTLEISPEQPVYGNDIIITANLPDDATGDITLTVDGIDYTVPVKDGKAVFTVESPDPGEHSVTASYPGDDKYNSASASGTFTVQAAVIAPTGISLDKQEINFTEDSSQVIAAVIEPAGATGTVIWSSSNESAATVTDNNDGTATVTAAGVGTAVITAAIQGTDFSDSCTVRVTEYICPHTSKTEIPAKAATCTEPGNNRYYKCDDCGEYLKADGTTVTTPAAESIPAPGHSYPLFYESNDTQHWQVCFRCYEDSAHDNHTFGATTYTWSADNSICTAKHTCTVCGKEVSETVDSTSQETPAACFTDGKIQYTATFTKPGFTIQTTEAPSGESAGHDWGAPSYVWSADNSTCTATRVCTRNADHKEEETVNAAVTTTATCTEAGVTTYASSFDNPAFEAQEKTVAVDALGHNREESIAKEATEDSLGIIEDRCTRCGDTDNTRLYLLDNTSPSKYPDGSYISENVVSSADNGTLGSDGIQMVLQDPLGAFDDYFITYSAELIGVSADPGADYDNAFEIENACRALVGVTINGTYIVGTFPEKARLLLQIPDGWDVDDIAALRINSGVDTYYVTAVEYRLYDAEGEFVKVVTADYEPAEGETVRAFAAFWTDYFYNSPYAIIDIYTDKDALDEYKDEAKNAIDALAQNGDSDEVREIIDNAKDAVDALGYDESKSLEENKAAVDALVDSAADDVADQREADKLAADKEAFDEYKDEAKNAIDALAQDGDSDEVREIIDNAKDEIDALGYDESKSLEENKAAVDALVDSAAGDIEDQRETEQTPVSVEIKDFTEETETGYKEDKTFTASAENLPEGAEIHWFVNGEDVGTGESYTVEDPTDDYTVQAKVLDKDGNVVKESAVHKVKVKNGFFDRLIAFILNLIEKILGKAIADFLSSVC